MTNMVSLPDNEQRHLTIGKQALQKGNYASAAAHLEKALKPRKLLQSPSH